MASNLFYLFKDRRFLPIFLVQFFGCLNDSILKNALIILITFKLANNIDSPVYLLALVANALFVLPFILLASLSGQLADRYERSTLVKIIKLFEVAIIAIAVYGFYKVNLYILFFSIALMGAHSTFFGPIKYSVLPDHMQKHELLAANGFVEAGTFLSILIGTMLGGFYNSYSEYVIGLMCVVAALGLIATFYMPRSNNHNAEVSINFNIVSETYKMIKYSASKKKVYLAILGISWFWFIGAAIMAQIPSLTRDILKADENVANLFLATFSIGVGLGSFLCNKLFEGKITTRYIFLSALGISIFGIELYFSTTIATSNYEYLKTVPQFLSRWHYIRILFDLFGLACVSGLYVVPLFALMQYFTSPIYRSRVIAANNLINSIFMIGSTALLSLLFYMEFSIPAVILIVSLLNMVIAIHIYQLIPNSKIIPVWLWKLVFKTLLHCCYKIEVKGLENYKKAGKRTIIIANHLSYLDPALIASHMPEVIQFAINMGVSREWWVKPFLNIIKTYPIDQNNPMAIKSLIEEVKKNKKIAIFPEGRTSVTGSLMKVYEGPGMIADKANATILPVRVDGTQFTIFAKVRKLLKGKFTFRRKITITVLPPVKVTPPEHLGNRERRKFIGQALYDIMSEMIFESSNYDETLFQTLINSANTYGMNTPIMQDIEGNKTSYRSLILKSFILSDLISRTSFVGEKIGFMLPNMVGSAITFFAAQASGRIPAMINFTSGAANITSACKTAMVDTVYTSKKFIDKAGLTEIVNTVSKEGINFIYLEDLRDNLSIGLKIKCLFASLFPGFYYSRICSDHDSSRTAVILFTSGTEGKPKAVALSHRNLQANRCQVLARVDFNPYDCAFNALPMFHSFGLTVTLLMGFSGVRTFFYPSPLHYRIIPEVVYDIGATIMFGTDTFLSGYAQYAHSYDFYSLRYVVAGAEKLKPRTRQTWFDKFGIKIYEGYGVTEAAPIISVNTPMHDKPGSVGRIMPKIGYHLKSVEGIKNGGRLCVQGPNIMQGYILPDNPGIIVSPYVDKLGANWYDTGDIVSVDDERYITILGRHKRFAKVAGEMVSLAITEEILYLLDSEANHAAVVVEDEKKGEQIIAFTTSKNMTRELFTKQCKTMNYSELCIPREIVHLKTIPVLATGKLDYTKIVELARELKHS